jgi:hypothetical protein
LIRPALQVGAEGEEMTRPQFTTAQYATIISTVAFFVSCGSLYVSKLSYDLSAAKDQREIRDKMPAVDVQIRPTGASSASIVISIINRADINIAPQDLRVEHSFEAGDLYLSSVQQSALVLMCPRQQLVQSKIRLPEAHRRVRVQASPWLVAMASPQQQ